MRRLEKTICVDVWNRKKYSNEILQNWNESLDALSSLEKENRLAENESEDLFIFASHLTKDHVRIDNARFFAHFRIPGLT